MSTPSSFVSPARLPVLLIPMAILVGIGLAMAPAATIGACAVVVALFAIGRTSHPVLVLFLLVLVFQDPLEILAGGDETRLGGNLKLLDEFFLLFLGTWCVLFSRRWVPVLTFRSLVLAVAGCFAGVILSTFARPVGWAPVLVDLALFSKPFLVLVIGASVAPDDALIARSRDWFVRVMLAVVVFGIVFLLVPAWQDAYVGNLRPPDERLGLVSAQGFFISPGTYSWFAASTFGICYAAYLTHKRNAYLFCAITAALFVVLSWRRRSIVAVLSMIVLAIVLRTGPGTRARALTVSALVLIVGLTVFAPYATGLWTHTVREYGGPDPMVNARVALYYTSLLIARDYFPLGTGLASFGSHASKLYYSDVYDQYGLTEVWGLAPQSPQFITDTYWPMILGEGGAVSLVAMFVMLGLLFGCAWTSTRAASPTVELRFLAIAALFLLTGSFVESTASHFYGSSLPATLGLMPVGMLLGRVYGERLAADRTSP